MPSNDASQYLDRKDRILLKSGTEIEKILDRFERYTELDKFGRVLIAPCLDQEPTLTKRSLCWG